MYQLMQYYLFNVPVYTFFFGWVLVLIVLIPFKKGLWWLHLWSGWFMLVIAGLLLGVVYLLHYSFFGLGMIFMFLSNIFSVPSSDGIRNVRKFRSTQELV